MLLIFIRTFIVFFFIIVVIRLMGKRQVGQLQASELVVTILISDIASLPLQNTATPLSTSIVSVLTLVILELLLSLLMAKNYSFRKLITGQSITLIQNGEINQKTMSKLRINIDDLLEEMRNNSIFSIDEVDTAIIETNGKLSFLLKSKNDPITPEIMKIPISQKKPQLPLIVDTKIVTANLEKVNYTKEKLYNKLNEKNLSVKQVFFLSADSDDNMILIQKE